ncbi:hypothetical protein Taro_004796, partial [Colocasia esculenta]|nr:hypothetical protein [Colocasia esculenta]
VYADFVMVVSTHPLLESTKEQAKTILEKGDLSGKNGICIQRSRVAPPREEEGEEEGEEEEELVIAAVLIKREIQPKLGSIVIQRVEYVVLCFGALVLWVGVVVLWCLSRGAQGLMVKLEPVWSGCRIWAMVLCRAQRDRRCAKRRQARARAAY